MGRIKDLLGDSPPTIGDCRRDGMRTFSVHCGPPCGHVATVAFDVLPLSDDAVFIEIPRLCRLRCLSCGRRAQEISAHWNEVEAYGKATRRPEWIVLLQTPDGRKASSSGLPSRERAIGLAHDLADKGDTILRIEGPGGIVTAEEIAAERRARRGSPSQVMDLPIRTGYVRVDSIARTLPMLHKFFSAARRRSIAIESPGVETPPPSDALITPREMRRQLIRSARKLMAEPAPTRRAL